MAHENETDRLGMEKIKLERLKVYGKIITVLISVGIGTFGVAYINHIIQKKRLEGQLKQEEMKYLGQFLDNALVDDHEKRLRFAEYFATLTISPELQNRWKEYRDGIRSTIKLLEEKKIELAKTEDKENRDKIATEVVQLQAQLGPLPEKSDVYLSSKKAERLLLDGDRRPKQYTENIFEVQKDGKVIYDQTTGLMWQQSGSENFVSYNEALNYITKLNQGSGFAGYNDWRLPTLKEAITLLKPKKMHNSIFIDPVFDNKQRWIWTSDLSSASSAWVVDFGVGSCGSSDFYLNLFVRAVR